MLLAMLAVAVGVTPLVTTQVQAQTNPGVTVTPSTLAFDEGTSDSYTVVLDTQPGGDVIIGVTPNFHSSSSNTVSISRTSLRFTTNNWDSPQTVTITTYEDSDGRDLEFDINHQVSGYYGVLRVQSVSVLVYDDDQPQIRLSNPRPEVDEGGNLTYTVWLNTRPDYQEIGMSVYSRREEIAVHPTNLVFTNENWRTPQTITITAAHDQDAIDDVSEVLHTFGHVYASGRITSAYVTARDDEKSRVITQPTSLTIEAGETERYWVWLDDLPYVNDLTVTITSDNPAVTVDPSTLTFDRASWTWTKVVDVTALDGPATLTHTLSGYDSVKTLRVSVPGGTGTTTTTTTPATTTTTPATTTTTPATTTTTPATTTTTPATTTTTPATTTTTPVTTTTTPVTTTTTTRPPTNTNTVVTTGTGTSTDTDTDSDSDSDSDSDTDTDTDTDSDSDSESGNGDESQSGENRIDCADLETQTPFVDVLESSPEAQAIACIYALGITTGTTPTSYSPAANVNRAQMASFLARLYKALTGTDAPIADTPFTDVVTTSPAYDDIGRIYGLGITTGTTPTTYSPANNVNRAQMASFLARLYKALTGTDAPIADTPFTDVVTTSPAYDDIGRIYGLGITTGTTPTTYSPANNVNRSQMASFLARLYDAIPNPPTPKTNKPPTPTNPLTPTNPPAPRLHQRYR